MNNSFISALQESIKSHQSNDWKDNWDDRRFGPDQSDNILAQAKAHVKKVLTFVGLYKQKTLTSLLLTKNESALQWLYERMSDEESKQILIDVMTYRVLGFRKVKLPLNTEEYWSKLEALERKANTQDSIELGLFGWKVDRYDLQDMGYPIQVYARAPSVFAQMLLQQYRCVTPDHVIEVGMGDTVIDAGGCYGDTALYFSHKAGGEGRVFSFEFMPENIKVFNRNLELNSELANRIEIVPNPLWSSSGEKLYVEGIGPNSHITPHPKEVDAKQVETLTIDDLAASRKLARIDFIKMDIEGAELEALKGAEDTIRRFSPKLAISVYHHLQDFWTIAQWIDGLGLNYRFYLRHFTIHAEETVLFAEASR